MHSTPAGSLTLKVILADSMDLALTGLSAILRQQADVAVIGTFRSLAGLRDALVSQRPDVIVLGDRLDPDLDALALVECVSASAPRAKIVVMGHLPNGLIVQALLTGGAAGYLYRGDVLGDCLGETFRTVMRGRPYLSPTANAEYLFAIQSGRTTWTLDGEARDVLRRLAHGKRPQEIALMRGVRVRRIYWVIEKLRERFGADTNEQLMVRAAVEGFLA